MPHPSTCRMHLSLLMIISDDRDTCAVIGRLGFWYPARCVHATKVQGFVCERGNTGYRTYVNIISTDESETSTDRSQDISTQVYQATDSQTSLHLYVVIPLLVLLGTSVVVVWRTCRNRNIKKPSQVPPRSAPLELSPILIKSLTEDIQIILRKLLLNRDDLDIQEELGRGAFGAVSKGILNHQDGGNVNVQTVAIKSLTGNYIGSDITAFVNEAITMAEFQHPHVLSIIGVCIDTKRDAPMIILPYMANGDLRTYLRALRRDGKCEEPPDERQLLLFCLHISLGMKYLSDQKIIHRDLAARNCMVNADLLVRVADFGLARDVYSDSYYRQDQQKLLPVRWMAMECLQDHVFSIQSDIWSFGVTMWEVFSMGRVPYMHLDNAHIAAHLETGSRLEQPDICPAEMYNLMIRCFKHSQAERPSFTEIAEEISNYIAQMCNYLDVNDKAIRNEAWYLRDNTEDCELQQLEGCTGDKMNDDLTQHLTGRDDFVTGFDNDVTVRNETQMFTVATAQPVDYRHPQPRKIENAVFLEI